MSADKHDSQPIPFLAHCHSDIAACSKAPVLPQAAEAGGKAAPGASASRPTVYYVVADTEPEVRERPDGCFVLTLALTSRKQTHRKTE